MIHKNKMSFFGDSDIDMYSINNLLASAMHVSSGLKWNILKSNNRKMNYMNSLI